MDKVTFTDPETGMADSFYVLEEAKIAGTTYLLVTEEEDGDSEAYILKQTSPDDAEEALYEMVEDDEELNALSGVFSEMLEDTVIEKEES